MATSPPLIYQVLPENSIRVLELQPGEPHEALMCKLVVQRITEKSYEAISYVWGNPSKDASLICNDTLTGITSNLGAALSAFRLKGSIRRLWADAICINQQDLREREIQVGLMRLIYSSAQNLLGWIGSDPGTAALAIESLRVFNRDPEECIQRSKALQAQKEENREEPSLHMHWKSWMAIKELFDMPFFHRVWIIQELGLAKHAHLYYGLHSIDWHEVSHFVFIMDNKAAFLVSHLQLKSWIVNHTNLIWQKLRNGQPKYSFLEVLNWARVHPATDERDRIYGFLGHPSAADKEGKLVVEPDYKISTNEAYVNFALIWINKTKELRILSTVDRDFDPLSSLPTWVPAWHDGGRTSLLVTPSIASPGSDDFISTLKIDGKAILRTRGFAIDNVEDFSEILDHVELGVTNLKNELEKKTPFWLDHFWKTLAVSSKFKNPTQKILDELSLTLVAGFRETGKPALECLEQHRADFASYVCDFENIRIDGPGAIWSSLSPQLRQSIQNLAVKGSSTQFVQDMTWICGGRRLFVTSHGHIGLGPRNMVARDLCCVLVGSMLPMILRSKKDSDTYFLVGEAILQSYMRMEAISLFRNGELEIQQFLLE